MKRLIVCCDGTWNTPKQEDNGRPSPTNVVKLFASLDDEDKAGIKQLAYYRPGVGTSGGLFDRLLGGGIGRGLGQDIKSAYKWLTDTYDPEDQIYLFGFSRGAYAVRSLAGMIARCGLLQHPPDLPEDQKWHRVEAAYRAYRRLSDHEIKWATSYPRLVSVKIHFLGVWDTVGALGIPDEVFWKLFEKPRKYQFHDTDIGDGVSHARHAVAMDERRRTFSPTLWTNECQVCDVVERWFVGVHGDVGGSYADRGLGDITLRWMIDEAAAKGLEFKQQKLDQIHPNPAGVLHDSVKGIFKRFRTRPRAVPPIDHTKPNGESPGPKVPHDSVLERQSSPPITQANYRPHEVPASGEVFERSVFARDRWNDTGLYLEKGQTYTFTATGSWIDESIPCDPDGPLPGIHFGQFVQLWGRPSEWLQGLRRMKDGNGAAVVWGARRQQAMPFFCLVGVIANGDGVHPIAKRLQPHETFRIGSRVRHTPSRSGYLYCFANDVWRFYFNNKGSVRLTVTRD